MSSAVDMHKLVQARGGGILRISDMAPTWIFNIPYSTKIKHFHIDYIKFLVRNNVL